MKKEYKDVIEVMEEYADMRVFELEQRIAKHERLTKMIVACTFLLSLTIVAIMVRFTHDFSVVIEILDNILR